MKREESIRLLNRAVADELQAVHQYMYFHFHLDNQGFAPLSMLFRQTAIQEMGHIERLAERILFLKGDVTLVPSGPVERILDPKQIVECAMRMEEKSAQDYNAFALECSRLPDSASKQIFEQLVLDEERHFDGFERQFDNIERFGLSYLALQSFAQGAGQPGGGPGPGPAAQG